MEALIFMFDVACMTYLCWHIYKLDPKRPTLKDLGFFRYQVTGVQPPADARKLKSSGSATEKVQERPGA